MYRAKDIKKYAKLENRGTIKTATGRIQNYNKDSFFTIEKDKEGNILKVNIVQQDIDGNPIKYITVKEFKERKGYDVSQIKSQNESSLTI